jgi:hypothetical protein
MIALGKEMKDNTVPVSSPCLASNAIRLRMVWV